MLATTSTKSVTVSSRATISQLDIVTVKNLSPIIINNKETVTMENFCHSFLPFDTVNFFIALMGVKSVLYDHFV